MHFNRVWRLIGWVGGGEWHFKVGGRTFQSPLYLCKLQEAEWTYLFLRVNPDFQTSLSVPFQCLLLERRSLQPPAHPSMLLVWHCIAQRIVFNSSNLFIFLFYFFLERSLWLFLLLVVKVFELGECPPWLGHSLFKMKGCTWVFVATLLCQQFCLFRVMAAKKERKMKKEPNQYTEPFNATLSNSEELHGHPKVGVFSVVSAWCNSFLAVRWCWFLFFIDWSSLAKISLIFKNVLSFCLCMIYFLAYWSNDWNTISSDNFRICMTEVPVPW